MVAATPMYGHDVSERIEKRLWHQALQILALTWLKLDQDM